MPGEELVGTTTEPKLRQWKWYLQEFIQGHKASAKGQTPARVEEITQLPIILRPSPITQPQKASLIGGWEDSRVEPTKT
jgi:hypothetical protein